MEKDVRHELKSLEFFENYQELSPKELEIKARSILHRLSERNGSKEWVCGRHGEKANVSGHNCNSKTECNRSGFSECSLCLSTDHQVRFCPIREIKLSFQERLCTKCYIPQNSKNKPGSFHWNGFGGYAGHCKQFDDNALYLWKQVKVVYSQDAGVKDLFSKRYKADITTYDNFCLWCVRDYEENGECNMLKVVVFWYDEILLKEGLLI